ncbi:MAG: TolB family protein [Bacteroidales bacterium]
MKSLIIYLYLPLLLGFNTAASNDRKTDLQLPASTIQHNSPADTTGISGLLIKPFLLEIIPPSSGIQFYRNGIIFLSHAKVDEKVPEKHLSFGTLKTFMTLVQDTIPGEFIPFVVSSDIVFPSEATTFTDDFNTMYLSLIPPRAGKEQIFKAIYRTTGWDIEEKPLSFCDENFIFTHPSLASDGTLIVFSSDLSGTAGGLDLYVARKEGEHWGKPENLGRHINSTGNELFAYLDDHKNLFFSSDGLPGEGGYDIFVCRYNDGKWEKPHNLSKIINTINDEVAFTSSRKDNSTAFYTSRKKNGKSKCELFSVTAKATGPSTEKSILTFKILAMAGAADPLPEASASLAVQASPTVAEQVKTEAQTKPVESSLANDPTSGTTRTTATTDKESQVAQPKPEATKQAPVEKKDAVIYRVQILANTRPVGSKDIPVAGTTYKSYEYLYKGGYRTTVGEFSTLSEALKLQTACRQNGYKEAFVVAFRNNVRDTDPALFK